MRSIRVRTPFLAMWIPSVVVMTLAFIEGIVLDLPNLSLWTIAVLAAWGGLAATGPLFLYVERFED